MGYHRGRFGALVSGAGIAGILVLAGCSGGGGGGGGGTAEAGIELPSEVSAVATREDTGGAVRSGKAARAADNRGLRDRLARLARAVEDLPADADYNTVQVRKFVEIKVLDVFGIIGTIFDAFRQTHYTDPANIGGGWYKCMVAFNDDGEGGQVTKNLQEWYINSELITSGGSTSNRVQAKILESRGDGSTQLIRVQVDITEAPTENDDGTLANLGEWEVRALFGEDDSGDQFFHATALVEDDGTARLTIHQTMEEGGGGGGPFLATTRAIIFRSLDAGYGAVQYPDFEACFMGGDCTEGPPSVTVDFAYNTNYLSIQVDGADQYSYDRTDEHEIVHRYQLFRTSDGANVETELSFGFPVRVEEDGRFGWYGAWQGRHQLWTNGDSLPDGTVVARNDGPPSDSAPTYTTKTFPGSLTKVNLVEGSLDQLDGIAAEIFVFNNFRLRWNDAEGRWDECLGDNGMGGCSSVEDFTPKLPSLLSTGEGDQKNIFLSHCEPSEIGFTCTNYVYLESDPSPAFFVAEFDPETGRFQSTDVPLDLESLPDGFEIFGSVNGRAYIQYTGNFEGPQTTTGWVERTVTDFDFSTYTPTFDDSGDHEFVFEVGRMYFVNNRGASLRVTRIAENGDAGDYQVFMEAQTVANPSNVSDVYPAETVLVEPWDPATHSSYMLDTDPESENYLLLVYHTVSDQDAADGISGGDVVTRDIWGLRIEGDESSLADATLYNYEYRNEGEYGGSVTYLLDADSQYVLLSDPLRLSPVQLASTNDIVSSVPQDDWLTYAMSFDGFLHGLPDTWWELQKVDFSGDSVPSVLSKNVRIPDGTLLTNQADDSTYYVKAVDVGIFLGQVDAFPGGEEPDLSQSDGIDLEADLPTFTAPDVDTTIPDPAELRYIEGLPFE